MKALRFHYSLPRIVFTKVVGSVLPAAFVGQLAPLRFDEVSDPVLPAEDWVRVRAVVAGVCGSDLKQVLLEGSWDNPMTALISFPHVLGHEVVGIVDAVGARVTRVRPGQRVLVDPWLSCRTRGIDPACAPCQAGDYTLCRNFDTGALPAGIHLGNNAGVPGAFARALAAHESQCIPLPDGVSDEAAVLADPFSVSLHSVLRAPPPADAPALVYGLGTLGLMAVAALRNLHPDVMIIAVGKHAAQCELATQFGASEVLVGDRNAVVERVAQITGAKILRPWSKAPWLLDGAGVTYDTVGSPETVETSLRVTRSRGTIVVSAPRRFEWTPLYFKEVALIGSNAFGMETLPDGRRIHAMEAYLEMCQAGLDVTPVITHRFPLESWRSAFRTLFRRRTTGAVKVLLTQAPSAPALLQSP
jgi:threonine dehydrogenase-like Zn-dependent dehydrogenase